MGILQAAAKFLEPRLDSLTNLQRSHPIAFSHTGQQRPPKRGNAELLALYGSSPWVRLALDVVAQRIAAARWVILAPATASARRSAKRTKAKLMSRSSEERRLLVRHLVDDGDLVEVDEHPLLDGLERGIPGHVDGYQAAKVRQVSRDLTGDEFNWIRRDERLGIPVELWPIPPHWVKLPSGPGEPYEVRVGGTIARIERRDMAWCKVPDPLNPYGRGVGIVEALDKDVEVDEQAAAHIGARFRNQARPDVLIAGTFDRVAKDEMEKEWLRKLQGALRSGVPHWIGYPAGPDSRLDVFPLTPSIADLQAAELRRNERDTILQVCNVPPNVIGATESSNRATAYMAEVTLRRNKIVPELEARRRWLQYRFLEPMGEEPAEFMGEDRLVVDYLLPPLVDEEQRLEAVKAAPWAADANELRELQGFGPRDDLDGVHFVPLNLTPTRNVGTEVPTPARDEERSWRAVERPDAG